MVVNFLKMLYLTGIVAAAGGGGMGGGSGGIGVGGGGFAPSIESSYAYSSTTLSPSGGHSTDADTQPSFLGRHNATVSVHASDTASLDCQVLRLNEKTVSWIRRRGDLIHILTVGIHTYHNDNRYSVRFENPNNWKLQIRYAQKRDEGLYECQISTHPPKIKRVYLSVTVPEIEVRDPRGAVVRDAYYRVDSTVGLQCVVMPAPPTRLVRWTKGNHIVNTMPEKGIRVDTTLVGMGISSWLHIARATESDSGNYTCSAGDTVMRSVRVHVLDGESSAAMQHSTTDGGTHTCTTSPFLVLVVLSIVLRLR
ncbi:hemicentin-1-like [Macrobrachium nipponense]|uniref:hemicentin-1-like n=1 Tax=Macrobrachium nipponense TaxID=159736 RepID=UPI0030C7DA68